ncbi:cell adhesion molecule 2-like [Crassostrea angulata]|uniref:cell adhesion molecule 2-like n=1 Tax=Magallana angulata TaxID=2784310 RepID=UPI0022B1C695|nr:cell adhesion molecule 2-like [Crassostrea angulata]
MKSFCDISCILLFLDVFLLMSVNCQKKNKGTTWSVVKTQDITVVEGQRVVVICRIPNNDTDATFQWVTYDSDMIRIKSNGPELVIESATVEDTGIYTCLLFNDVLKKLDVRLTVKQTTTSTTTTTTTEPPTTTNSTTITAGLQICMFVVYYI